MNGLSKRMGLLIAASILTAGAAASAEDEGSREERRAEMLERWDADGDGRLSREERGSAREGGEDVGRRGGRHGGEGGYGRRGRGGGGPDGRGRHGGGGFRGRER